MKKGIQLISWSLLALSILAWGGVWYAGSYLVREASVRASSASVADQQVDKIAFTQRLKTLASDTRQERGELDSLVSHDVVSIVNIIESTGSTLGVDVQVNDALPLGVSQTLPDGSTVRAVAFVIESQGSYASLMRLLGRVSKGSNYRQARFLMATFRKNSRTYHCVNLIMSSLTNIYRQLRELYDARHEPEHIRPLAEIYWRILLLTSVLCIALILAYGVSEFVTVLGKLGSGGSAGSSTPVVLDRNQLTEALDAYRDRQARPGVVSGGGDILVDPSR
jgi:hypothetical protein